MGDFDESKVTRDEHGRFSGGGLGAFAAKHEVPKLEGYSGAKGGLDKWAGKVSGRQRDVEVPLASKTNAQGDFASTGNIPLEKGAHERLDSFLRGMMPKENGLYAAAKKAAKSYDATARANDKLVRDKDAAQHGGIGAKEWTAKDEKKLQKSNEKLAAAKKIVDDAHAASKDAEAKRDALTNAIRSVTNALAEKEVHNGDTGTHEGAWNPRTGQHNPLNLEAFKGKDITVNATVDRKDGTVELHFAGKSNDPKYPGDKELHVTIKPELYTNTKDAYDAPSGGMAYRGERSDREETIATQYPSDERGKAHPNEVNLESKGFGNKASFYMPTALREHLQKFKDS